MGVNRVGCVVQWYNVGPWPACFRCPALGLQLMGDHLCGLVGWLEFNVPFQHKYGYIREELMWVSHPLQVSQPGQLSLSSFRGR